MLNPSKKITKIAVLVSGGGTNLQALIDAEKRGEIPDGKIVLVIASNREAYALERAQAAGITAFPISRKEFETQGEFEGRIGGKLLEYGIDLVVLAGFMCILSKQFVARYPDRIINIHPSLIPSFCGKGAYGLHVHEMALEKGVKVTGATVHYVNEIPDGGKIIAQKAVCVCENDTPETLQKRVMEQAEHIILPEAVAKISKEIAEKKR